MIKRWLKVPEGKSCLMLGPRRAGKTTLLRQELPGATYVTLDDFDHLQLAKNQPKSLFEESEKQVIVDEIQRVPSLMIVVKDFIDNYGKTVWMTGSSSLGLLSSGAETLAGRIKLLECPTLCWGEESNPRPGKSFSDVPLPLVAAKAARSLKSWLRFGGFPEVRTQPTDRMKAEILKDYRNTYFARDLLLLSNIEDSRGLLACMNHLALSLGSRTDVSSLSKESGLSYPTALKYLNVLEASRLVFRLTGYQFGPAKRQIKSNKYYFCDVSVPTALGVEIAEGQRFELFVMSEIEKRRKLGRFAADHLFYYESEKGKEVDLVIDEGRTVTAIEIKSTVHPSPRDASNLRTFKLIKKKAKLRKILITRSEAKGKIGDVELWPVHSLYQHL